MKIEQTQGSFGRKPGGLIWVVIMGVLAFIIIGADVANTLQAHYYPFQNFICHLLLLLCFGLEYSKYTGRIRKWNDDRQKWRDQFNGKKDEPE